MHKIILIIKREFLTRVRKRTFIIGTILFPVLYIGLIFGTGYIANKTKEDMKIALIDQSGLFTQDRINAISDKDTSNILQLVTYSSQILKDSFDSKGFDGYVIIPANFNWKTGVDSILVNTKKSFGMGALTPVEKKINQVWDAIKRDSLGLDSTKETILGKSVELKLNNEKIKTPMPALLLLSVTYVVF